MLKYSQRSECFDVWIVKPAQKIAKWVASQGRTKHKHIYTKRCLVTKMLSVIYIYIYAKSNESDVNNKMLASCLNVEQVIHIWTDWNWKDWRLWSVLCAERSDSTKRERGPAGGFCCQFPLIRARGTAAASVPAGSASPSVFIQ